MHTTSAVSRVLALFAISDRLYTEEVYGTIASSSHTIEVSAENSTVEPPVVV